MQFICVYVCYKQYECILYILFYTCIYIYDMCVICVLYRICVLYIYVCIIHTYVLYKYI